MTSAKPSTGRKANSEGQMPLMDHLRELRNRLMKIAIALVLGAIVGFFFFGFLWDFLKQPFCNLPVPKQSPFRGGAAGMSTDECSRPLVVHGIFEGFFLRLKVSLIAGAILSSPVWLYQLWAFVAPGMRVNERKYSYTFVGVGVPLFLSGAVLAYLVLSKGLALLLSFIPNGAIPLIGISEYLKFAVAMLIIFGASFELPLLVTLLNLAGILSYERLKKWRRWIVFGVVVFAAVATPSQDPISMLSLAVPIAILMEIATQIAKFHDRRKARRDALAAYEQIDDNETSPLDLDDTQGFDGPEDADGRDRE